MVAGCKKAATTERSSAPQAAASPAKPQSGEAYFDVCGLIKKEEIEAVQGSPITNTKSSGRSDGTFRVSQCFYSAREFSKSVNLTVTQSDLNAAAKRSPRDFWKGIFGRYKAEAKESEADKEKRESLRGQARTNGEEKESTPPRKVNGVGDDAYWAGNPVTGGLYVLKRDTFIRISVGGADNQQTKIDKAKKLAEKALQRL